MTKQVLFQPGDNCEDGFAEKELSELSATKHPTMLKRFAKESYFKGLVLVRAEITLK